MTFKSFHSKMLCVCSTPVRHLLFIEHYGSPNGIPIIILHGGPGGKSHPINVLKWNVFDLTIFRLVFVDQRGCGQSTPRDALHLNTPQHTVNDIEFIRQHYMFKKILLFGQSYGTALVLMYATQYTRRVLGCILHGTFLCEDVFPSSLRTTHPRIWKRLQTVSAKHTLRAVSRVVSHSIQNNKKNKRLLINAWCALEDSELKRSTQRVSDSSKQTLALLESYYHLHSFFGCGKHLLKKCSKHLQNTPILLLHGEKDYICPIQNAERLHRALCKHKHVEFERIPNGKHYLQCSSRHHQTASKMIAFLNHLVNR